MFRELNPALGKQNRYGSLDTIGVRGSIRLKPSDDLDIKIGGYYANDDPIGYPEHYVGLIGMAA